VPIYNDFGDVIGKWMDYGAAKFDIRIVAGTTMPVNRWALLEEYFRWFQSGLIDDIAMIAETDIRNKKSIINRNSMLAKLKSQLEQMDEAIKDKDGTIETLERQLVQAGIKMRVKDAEGEVRKDVLETEAQQKLLRNMMKNEFDSARKDIQRGVQKAEDDAKNKQESN
jgi:DNA-binding MarR family transcriptional regulator